MMQLNAVYSILERLDIDYTTQGYNFPNLWLRRRDGTLLRSFIVYRDNYIDINDFMKWLEYYENFC